MDKWDPMMQAFEDKHFNRYNEGVGRDLSGSVHHDQGVQLFAQNIPADLKEGGFRNLFAEYGRVLSSKLMQPKGDSKTTIGFITMEKMVDANAAISKLNKKRIGQFIIRVVPALTDEEKEHRKKLKQQEAALFSSSRGNALREDDGLSLYSVLSDSSTERGTVKRTISYGSGGNYSGLELDRNDWHSLSKAAEESSRTVPKLAISIGRGSPRQVQEKGESIHLPQEDPLQSLGRGVGARDMLDKPAKPEGFQQSQPLKSYGAGRGTFASAVPGHLHSVGRGFSTMPNKPPGPRSAVIEPPKSARVEGVKLCAFCYKPGCVNLCSRCKMYYCSADCQKSDWPRHKDICIAIGGHFKNGDVTVGGSGFRESPKKNAKCYETDIDSMMSDPFRNSQARKKEMRNYDSDNLQNGSEDRRYSKNVLKPRSDNRNKKGVSSRKQTSSLKKEKGITSKSSDNSGNLSSSEEENWKEKQQSDFGAKEGGSMEKKGGQITSKPSSVAQNVGPESLGRSTAARQDKTQQVLEGGELTNTMVKKVSLDSGDASTYTPEILLPVKSYGEAYLTYYENPYNFWICLKDYMEAFAEMAVGMAEQLSQSVPNTGICPKVGDMYAAVAMDEWCRLRVVSVKGQKVTAYFVDYGNTADVKCSDLRSLTKDMLSVPAQAIHCRISKLKPTGSDHWSEAANKAVIDWLGNPLSKILQYEVVVVEESTHGMKISVGGEALSEVLLSSGLAERTPKNPVLSSRRNESKQAAQESRFMAHALFAVMGEHKVGDKFSAVLTDIQSVEKFSVVRTASNKILEELTVLLHSEYADHTVPYRPAVGEIVAAKYSQDGSWYRSEVISVTDDKFSLFFVDYGNSEVQTMVNIRPLKKGRMREIPAQAIMCHLSDIEIPSDVDVEIVLQEFKTLMNGILDDLGGISVLVKDKTSNHLIVDLVPKTGLVFSQAFSRKLASLTTSSKVESLKSVSPDVKVSPKLTQAASKSTQQISELSCGVNKDNMADIEVEKFPKVGERVSVNVSYVKDYSELYVRLNSVHSTFINMMKDLNVGVDSLPALSSLTVGRLVAVRFSQDHVWYRGRVEKIDGAKCWVYFIDYGNSETAEAHGLRELSVSLCHLPAQAIRCHLSSNRLSDTARLKEELEDMPVEVKVLGCDDKGFSVQMFADGTNIEEHLMENAEEKTESSTAPISDHIPSLKLEQNVPVKVECVNMISPAEFYVQVTDHIPSVVQATLNLKSRLELAPQPVTSVSVGDFVAGKFSQDTEVIWYRVRVDSISGNKCTIFFVDYGNFEETNMSELMQLSAEDFSLPSCTVKCRLKGCKTPNSELTKEFAERGQFQVDSILVISQDADECLVDILDCDGKCITNLFSEPETTAHHIEPEKISPATSTASEKLAIQEQQKKCIQTESLPVSGELVPAVITHIDSCSLMYVRRNDENLQSDLLQLMTKLNESAESLPKLSKPSPGTLCAAQFSQDQSWYRAQIEDVCNTVTCIIQFIDYGNAEETTISNLRELPTDLMQLPGQAICCCLAGHDPAARATTNPESVKVIQKFREEMLEKQVGIKVMDRKDNKWIIKMANEHGETISSKYMPPEDSQATPNLSDIIFETPPLREFDAIICHMNNLSDFYCQRIDQTELQELQQMSEELKKDVSKLGAAAQCEPMVDGIYMSKFQNSWYRCVVQKVKDTTVHVQYIDYGNSEEIPKSQLQPLAQERLAMPVRLLTCKLHGVKPVHPNWLGDGMVEYLEILQQRQPHVIVEGEDEEGLLVSLFVGDGTDVVNVAADLVSINLAEKASTVKEYDRDSHSAHAKQPEEQNTEEEDLEELELQRKIQELQRQLELSQQKKNKFKH